MNNDYMKALVESRDKWQELSVASDEVIYNTYITFSGCAVCGFYGVASGKNVRDNLCKQCFLNDNIKDKACSLEVVNLIECQKMKCYTAFRTWARKLTARIQREIDRVEKESWIKDPYKYLTNFLIPNPFYMKSGALTFDGIDKVKSEPPKSAHKAGEPFDDKWEYAGVLRVPKTGKDTWLAKDGDPVGLHTIFTRTLSPGIKREILRPRKPKAKLPRIKVEVWNKNAERSEYYFSGEVDWERLAKETFGDGAEVVRVTPVKGSFKCPRTGSREYHPLTIMKYRIKYMWWSEWNVEALRGYFGWYSNKNEHFPSDADIVSAIREHNRPTEKYTVGEVVPLRGANGLPNGNYKIISEPRLTKQGDVYVVNNEFLYATNDAAGEFSECRWIVAPMPSTGYYDFEIEGIKCRAYIDENGCRTVRFFYMKVQWNYSCCGFSDAILNAVDARLKRERGYGIVPVPYVVSGGNFEAPEAK